MRSSIVKYRFCRRRHRAGDVQFSRPEFSPMVTACSNRLNWGRESVWWWWRKTAGVKFSCSKMALINIIVIKYNIINIVLTEEKKRAGSAQWEGRSGQNYFLMFFLSSGIVLKIWRNFKILIFWKLLKLIKKFRVSFLKINANLTAPKFLQRKTQVLACKLKWFVDKAGSSSLTQFASTTPPPASAVGNLRSHLPLSGGRPSYPVRGQTRSSPGKLS